MEANDWGLRFAAVGEVMAGMAGMVVINLEDTPSKREYS